MNVNWIKGRHNVRFGSDIYYQALNHTQPEISGGDSFGARGGFRFQGGPTQIQGGPSGNQYNAFASFLLGVPNRIGRLKLVEPYTTRNWQYSLYVRDQWQAISKLTVSYGTRWEYFPVPTRADRGLERYNVETNQMMIGGVGSVPKDLGVKVSKTMFAPRVGMTYRPDRRAGRCAPGSASPTIRTRWPRPLRTNHPAVLNLLLDAPNSLAFVSRTSRRHPADPRSGPRQRDHPGAEPDHRLHAARRFRPRPHPVVERGGPEGAALGLHRRGGLRRHAADRSARVPRAELVADRRRPGGPAVEPASSAATGQTRLIAPIGDSQYDALQTRLERRFAERLPDRRQLHVVEVDGDRRQRQQRRRAPDQHPRVLRSEQVAQRLRSHAQPAHHEHHRAAVRARAAAG